VDKIGKAYKKLVNIKPHGFWPGFVVGFFYFSYIFFWLWDLYPLSVFGLSNRLLSFVLISFVFLLSVSGMAFFWGIFSFFANRLNKNINQLLVSPLLASIFIFLEYLRSWGFGVIWWGSGSTIGPHWTIGNPAYFLSNTKLALDTLSIWGIYGLDFVLALFIISSFLFFHRNKKGVFLFEILISIVVFLLVGLIGSSSNEKSSSAKIPVALIQASNPTKNNSLPEELLSDFKKKLELLNEAANKGKIVVFPEVSNFSKTLHEIASVDSVANYFNKISKENITIIDSARSPGSKGFVSRSLFISSKNGIIGFNDKKLLTPGGEYLPYLVKIPLLIFEPDTVKEFSHFNEFTKGSDFNNLIFKETVSKVAICSDFFSPSLFQKDSYGFIIGQNSLGILEGNKLLESQELSALKFRAAENQKYAVLASNFGHSYIVNSSGTIEKSTTSTGYQILTANIVPNSNHTWYNRVGDLPIFLLSLAIFGIAIKNHTNAKQD